MQIAKRKLKERKEERETDNIVKQKKE